MTEQDMLNKIKESAEVLEIPESLQPKQMEQKIKAGKQPIKFKWQAMHLVAAAVLLVFMLGVIPFLLPEQDAENGSLTIGGEKTDSEEFVYVAKQDAGELYTVAKSEQEVYDFLKENAVLTRDYYTGAYGAVAEGAIENLANEGMSGVMEDTTSQSKYSDIEYSKTNLQMADVDESDIVKTNGSHIFIVKNGVIQIVKIDNGRMEKVGNIVAEMDSFTDNVLEMYVDGDRLVLIVQRVEEDLTKAVTEGQSGGLLPLEGDKICCDVAYRMDVECSTILYTYDISKPEEAKQIGKIEQDGSYKTSRKVGDIIYLFTTESVALQLEMLNEENTKLEDALPKVNGETLSYDCIYLPKQGQQSMVVSSISLDKPNEVVDNTLIFNDDVEIYVSSEAMYLYNTEYISEVYYTQIAKFSLNQGEIAAVGAATVPGSVQDTFAINEYQGNLRILTTQWADPRAEDVNQLYIMDEKLKPVGKIENIASGEIIYAACYLGDIAYFITYRTVDPLFAADLSDINNPKIVGELKVTGYSEYLHMWEGGTLLGIGYETDEKTGKQEGIKLVMFDSSDPSELSVIDSVVIKEADYSPALYNYKSVLVDAKKNMIAFASTDYSANETEYQVYSFTNGKFKRELTVEEKEISQIERYRGLWAGDYFYIVSSKEIQSFDYTNGYEEVDKSILE